MSKLWRLNRGLKKTLTLAPGTKAKLRNLMHAIFNHAMRWEFFHRQPDYACTTVSEADTSPRCADG